MVVLGSGWLYDTPLWCKRARQYIDVKLTTLGVVDLTVVIHENAAKSECFGIVTLWGWRG